MTANAERLRLFPAAARQFLADGGTRPYRAGERLRQPDLAATLRRIMRDGPQRGFYRGTFARRLARDMAAPRTTGDPGLVRARDLAGYRARWRTAVTTAYRDRTLVGAPPPTSGGITVLQIAKLLEGTDVGALGRTSADFLALVAEAQKLAWADRGKLIADPAFTRVPTAALVSGAYADARRGELTPQAPKATYPAGSPEDRPEASTTHVSVIDRHGAAIAVTCTVEQEFGSAVVVPGTGVLLNNELTDFGAPGSANEPAPGKRPRSSMSPTLVLRDGRPELVVGGAGGSRIIMGTLLAVLGTVDFGLDPAATLDAPRVETGGALPLALEDGRLDPAVVADLERRGYPITREGRYAARPRVQAAGLRADGRTWGASDPRTDHATLAERVRAAR
jgi:gamma-glutamyltranspeptidase/glutathione hydrolase